MKCVREVRMAGEPKLDREHRQIWRSIGESLERHTQPKPDTVLMQTQTCPAPKNAGKVKGRAEDSARDSCEAELFVQLLREYDLRGSN